MKTLVQIYKQVADEQGLTPQQVKQESDLYWKLVRTTLSKAEHQAVRVKFLGVFYATPSRTIVRLAYYLIRLRAARKNHYKSRSKVIEQECTEYIPKLWKLKQKMGWRLTPNAKKLKRI